MTAAGLLALIASGALPSIVVILTIAGLIAHLLLTLGIARVQIPPAWTSVIVILYFGFYPVEILYLSQEWVTATVNLVCFLSIVRSVTATTSRDFFFVKLLAFLALVAATLLSETLSFLIWFLVFLFCAVLTLCLSDIRSAMGTGGRRNMPLRSRWSRHLATLAMVTTLGTVALTAALFFILPRTARAALRSFAQTGYHLPGFSSEITLGQIGELKTESTPVMHVRIEEPNQELQLKWRGSALSQFDGKRWYNPAGNPERILLANQPVIVASDDLRRTNGRKISYQVRLADVHTDALFFAGIPELIQIDGISSIARLEGNTFRIPRGLSSHREYQAVSILPDDLTAPAEALDDQRRQENLLLPATTDQRIIALSRSLAAGQSPMRTARTIEQHLRTQYSYTSELLQKSVPDPLAHFLFDRRQGHCEYFASAMAVMLRVVHIPARVVTGFQSGHYNELTGWHVVRASDAHSWVEAWLPDRGWVTFDPTPPAGQPSPMNALWTSWLLYVDAADTLWRQWVVGYDFERQIDLAARMERRSRHMRAPDFEAVRQRLVRAADLYSMPVLSAIACAALLVVAYAFRSQLRHNLVWRKQGVRLRRGLAEPTDATVLYTRMLKTLGKWGISKPGWLTPGEFALAVPPSVSPALVRNLTDAYHALRYGGDRAAGHRMSQLLVELEADLHAAGNDRS